MLVLPKPMATPSTRFSLSSSTLIDGRPPRKQAVAAAPPHCVSLPSLVPPNRERWKTTACSRRLARNVVTMATGETPAEVGTDLPEIMKPIQESWDKLEDKYAVTSLTLAVAVALWGSTGMISAIDRLPLVPGILELIGIGYTGWFAYRNLIFKRDREELVKKIIESYNEIIGS